eukprot:CAMPEP_0184325164 /NCGR_PEP_ID=MMETSP1049-20130417/139112_1 /TAXON_ID=77928 /ORGANISM="Proteomonas sulcata, Strain CCMP704" /LENGTH=294 /DNA_ID=CAMNT_0026647153 /DNA_START=192 /DNA_END=1076 /DNA_ORIENTATION=-
MKGAAFDGRGKAFLALMLGSAAMVLAAMSYSYFEGSQVGRVELGAVSSQAMATILKRVSSKKIVPKTTTEKLQDQILKEKNRIAELKLKSSNAFAKWEKQDSIATSAKTKATSLHEIYQQDKARQRMLSRKLETLTAKLTKHLSVPSRAEVAVVGGKEHHMSGSAARNEMSDYFQQLAKDTAKEDKVHKAHKAHKVHKAHKTPAHQKAHKKSASADHTAAHVVADKKKMVQKLAVQRATKRTAALKQVGAPNMWDKESADNFSKVYHAQHNLKKLTLEADKQLAANAAKTIKKI